MTTRIPRQGTKRQDGATLATALIMLVVLTLLVLSAVNSTTLNLRIATNDQMQAETVAAAQQATEQVLSSNFTISPASQTIDVYLTHPTPVSSGAVTYSPDYVATVATPTCTGSRALLNNEPNLPTQCISSGSLQNTGIKFASGTVGGTSWCYAQQWEIQTNVTDPKTGATAEVHQGVSLYVPAGTYC